MTTRLPGWLRQHLAALRILLVLTVLLGLAYPLAMTGLAQAIFPAQAKKRQTFRIRSRAT